jgi:methionyl-tRNA synthetase
MNLEGQKISTSRNWAIWAHEFAAAEPDLVDVLRYVLTAEMPETNDSDFTWAGFLARNNNELVAVLGNFVNRVVNLLHKYYAGKVPANLSPAPEDTQLLASIRTQAERIAAALERFRFREALNEAMQFARLGNGYLQQQEPWKLAKTDPARVESILYTATQACAALGGLFAPFMPEKSAKLLAMLGLPTLNFAALEGEPHFLPTGSTVAEPVLLFRKLDDSFVAAQEAKLQAMRTDSPAATTTGATEAASIPAPAPSPTGPLALKPNIEFPDFEKLDLRVATITAAAPVPKADRLLQLTLDLGFETRTVVSGIAQYYAPEAIVGQQVVLVANLAPRKLRGVLSQGMVLMAENPDGSLRFVAPTEGMANGSGVR